MSIAIVLAGLAAIVLLLAPRRTFSNVARLAEDPEAGSLVLCAGGPLLHMAGVREAVIIDEGPLGSRTFEVWHIAGGDDRFAYGDRWLVVRPRRGAADLIAAEDGYHAAIQAAYRAVLEHP